MPYLAHYEHGHLRYVKRSREGCDLEWATLLTEMIGTDTAPATPTYAPHDYAVVRYTPACVYLECAGHTGRYAASNVPCVCLTIQTEKPSVPKGWP